MHNAPEQPAQVPVQPRDESPNYETPAIKKIGSMALNTRPAKSIGP
jgi:hypothetical protein